VRALADSLRDRDGMSATRQTCSRCSSERRDQLPPEVVAAVEKNLAEIDRAIAEIHSRSRTTRTTRRSSSCSRRPIAARPTCSSSSSGGRARASRRPSHETTRHAAVGLAALAAALRGGEPNDGPFEQTFVSSPTCASNRDRDGEDRAARHRRERAARARERARSR
jgi:hypothetical protein